MRPRWLSRCSMLRFACRRNAIRAEAPWPIEISRSFDEIQGNQGLYSVIYVKAPSSIQAGFLGYKFSYLDFVGL